MNFDHFRFQEFMNSAQFGVIYFSFGTYLKFNDIPQEKLTQILEALGSLKQKVLIRANGEIPNLPPNCFSRDWFFQNEILAHPKMILFITHGEENVKTSIGNILKTFFQF